MNKKNFKYFYIFIILLIIANINFIYAGEIDQSTDATSNVLNTVDVDDAGIDLSSDIKSVETSDEKDESNDLKASDNDEDNLVSNSNGINSDNSENNLKIASNEDSPIKNMNENEDLAATGNATDNSLSSNTSTTANTSQKQITLKKSYLSSLDYVIKSKYLSVSLKDRNKKAIPNERITLRINGKTLSATTNKKGIAKFKINQAGKTYKVKLKFEGNSIYNASNKTFKLRVIAKPVYTKITIAETGIIKNEYLKIYLKTSDKKAIAKQTVKIKINGKTYTRTTNKNGLAKLKLNFKAKKYNVIINYTGKSNYMPSIKKAKINILDKKIIGKTSYGEVQFIGTIGNQSSKKRIAYVVGLHPIEHQAHDAVYKIMKNKVDMNYKYYIYRIVLTKKSGDYSTDRMRGQKLAKKYIVPHAIKQKYNLVVDIHSTTGTSYAKTYFIHVPKNKHAPSMKLAKKTIKKMKSIEKNSKIVYWSPESQTSPPYLHLPLIKAGTPTFVFETWTYEKKTQTDKRAKILTTAIDEVFS